jgi:hypothetical protein
MNSKEAKRIRKATQYCQREANIMIGNIKKHANSLPFHKRAQVAIAVLLGRW